MGGGGLRFSSSAFALDLCFGSLCGVNIYISVVCLLVCRSRLEQQQIQKAPDLVSIVILSCI